MNAVAKSFATLFASAAIFALGSAPVAAVAVVTVDCAHLSRPSQVLAGAWAGTDNLGAAYHARFRLMAEVNRACRRQPGARVEIVLQHQPSGRAGVDAVAQNAPR